MAPFFAHPFDMYSFYTVGQEFVQGVHPLLDYFAPYSYSYFLFAFPAAAVFNALTSVIGPSTIPISSINPILNPVTQPAITVIPGLLFDFLEKLPLIASDTIIAVLVYRLVSLYIHDDKQAVTAAALWFLNPLTIWVSSGWGMMDTLPALFTVLALYFVLQGRFALSGVSTVVGVAMKFYPLVLLFPLLLIAWRRGGRTGFAGALIGTLFASLVLFLPSLNLVTSKFMFVATTPSFTSTQYSGISFWTALTLFLPSFNPILLSLAITGILMFAAYAWMWRKEQADDIQTAAAFFALPVIILLLSYRFVGENFFVWLFPFGAILAMKGIYVKRLFWFLSLVALVSSITDSLLPYYMLPMAPWIGNYLASALAAVAPYRVAPGGEVIAGLSFGKVFLSSLGIVTALGIVLSFLGCIKGGTLGLLRSSRSE